MRTARTAINYGKCAALKLYAPMLYAVTYIISVTCTICNIILIIIIMIYYTELQLLNYRNFSWHMFSHKSIITDPQVSECDSACGVYAYQFSQCLL